MKRLTNRQQVFIEFYLQSWKSGESAMRAGYVNPDVQGSRLMKNPLVREQIDARLTEISMRTDEVLARLTQQARANIGDFLIIDGQKVSINLDAVKSQGYLIKRITWSRRGEPGIELYDSQVALTLIGKARRMFVEQIEETHHLEDAEVRIYIPENHRGD